MTQKEYFIQYKNGELDNTVIDCDNGISMLDGKRYKYWYNKYGSHYQYRVKPSFDIIESLDILEQRYRKVQQYQRKIIDMSDIVAQELYDNGGIGQFQRESDDSWIKYYAEYSEYFGGKSLSSHWTYCKEVPISVYNTNLAKRLYVLSNRLCQFGTSLHCFKTVLEAGIIEYLLKYKYIEPPVYVAYNVFMTINGNIYVVGVYPKGQYFEYKILSWPDDNTKHIKFKGE